MTPEEARRLLGGYATGTLTEAEQQALFAAALEDQELFDELAREQSLHDLLRDPAAKGRLLAALDEPRRAWWRSWKPAAVLAMAGVAAVAVVVGTRKGPAPVEMVARVELAPASAPVSPVPIAPQPAPSVERRDAARPQAKAKVEPPAQPDAAPVTLAEAPKADALKAEEAASPLRVMSGAPPQPPRDMAVSPRFEQSSGAPPQPPARAEIQAFAPATADTSTHARIVAETRASARALFQATTSTPLRVQQVVQPSPQSLTLGVRYSILREGDQGPALRITSNVNGYLSIAGATPVSLTAMRPYTTEALSGDEVKVVFSRRPETVAIPPAVPLTEVSEGETYVVSPNGAALSFTIPLKQQ